MRRAPTLYKNISRCYLLLLLILFLMPVCISLAAEESVTETHVEMSPDDCRQTISLLADQQKEYSREFRQIKREIALLKETMSKPGLTEILGGIGYILGLFGLSYYWHARNLLKDKS